MVYVRVHLCACVGEGVCVHVSYVCLSQLLGHCMEQLTSEKMIPKLLIHQVLCIQKEATKTYDPNLYMFMPSCYSYSYYHRQWSRAISKRAELDCGILKQYSLLLIDHAILKV